MWRGQTHLMYSHIVICFVLFRNGLTSCIGRTSSIDVRRPTSTSPDVTGTCPSAIVVMALENVRWLSPWKSTCKITVLDQVAIGALELGKSR